METEPKRELKKPTSYDILIPNSIDGGYAHDLYDTLDKIISKDRLIPIRFKIDTYGGNLNDCLEISRLMEQIPNPVITEAVTKCDSGGILLVASGDVGARFAHANTEFIAHQVQWKFTFQGSHPELRAKFREYDKINSDFLYAMAAKSKLDKAVWRQLTRHDYKFGSEEARDRFGIIDLIIPCKHGKGIQLMAKAS